MTKRADLYEALGVNPDADSTAIKAGWKRAMKQAHPDQGGSRKAFDLVQTALMVLSDPARRARYDRDGTFDAEPEVDNETAAIREMLAECIEAIIADASTPDDAIARIDMVGRIRTMLGTGRKQLRQHLAGNARLRKRARRLLGRFVIKKAIEGTEAGSPSPLIEALINRRVGFYDEEDDKITAKLCRIEAAEEILAGLRFDQEQDVDLWPNQYSVAALGDLSQASGR